MLDRTQAQADLATKSEIFYLQQALEHKKRQFIAYQSQHRQTQKTQQRLLVLIIASVLLNLAQLLYSVV